MIKYKFFLLLIILVICFTSIPGIFSQEQPLLKGVVYCQYIENGKTIQTPLNGIIVELSNNSNKIETITDSSGYFAFSVVPDGSYNLKISFSKEVLKLSNRILDNGTVIKIEKEAFEISISSSIRQDLGKIIVMKYDIQTIK